MSENTISQTCMFEGKRWNIVEFIIDTTGFTYRLERDGKEVLANATECGDFGF